MKSLALKAALRLLPEELNPLAVIEAFPVPARVQLATLADLIAGAGRYDVERMSTEVQAACALRPSNGGALELAAVCPIPPALLEAIALTVGEPANPFGLPAHIAESLPGVEVQAATAAQALTLRARSGGIVGALIALYGAESAGRIASRHALLVAADADPAILSALRHVSEFLT